MLGKLSLVLFLILMIGLCSQCMLYADTQSGKEKPKVNVQLLEEKVLCEDYWYPNGAAFFDDGTIIVPMCLNIYRVKAISTHTIVQLTAPDDIMREMISRDGGKTWKATDTFIVRFDNGKGVRVTEPFPGHINGDLAKLKDGSIIGVGGNVINHLIRPDQESVPYVASVRRAKSLDDLLAGKYDNDFVVMSVPDLTFQKGDSDQVYTGNVEAHPVELDNGDLLVAMSGRFKQDNIRVPYHKWDSYQFRNWVCISKDKGKTWNYLSTIGDPNNDPLPEMAEGYNETDMVRLKGNSILAVMRTGGNPDPDGTGKRYTYLASSISRDGGKTWSKHRQIGAYGVWPRVIRLKNGSIVCSAGRPGVFFMVSKDDGETWSDKFIVTDTSGQWSRCSSGYSSIGEIEPGVLTVLYDDIVKDDKGEITAHVIKMRKYKVD